MNTNTDTVSLADLISVLYDEYFAIYGDEDIASVAAAATVNDILAERARCASDPPRQEQAA